MAGITLELLAGGGAYDLGQSIVLELVNHVHQRIERFRYLDDIKPVAAALDYVENRELDSWINLQIANKTYAVPANSDRNAEDRKEWSAITSQAIASPYKSILITNKVGVSPRGKKRPLFWRHELPANVTSCQVEVVSRGNTQQVDTGYRVDLEGGNLYTNYKNFFNQTTGAYTLFFVTCTDSEGNTYHELLDPVPVAVEASWEDIDLDTGKLITDRPLYTSERASSGYTFYLNTSDTWYSRPVEGSLIQPRRPSGRDPEDSWYLRFSAGDLNAFTNSAFNRYYIPEYDRQNYSPYKPYVYSTFERLLRVNEQVLAATRRSIAIKPDIGLHLTIFVSDYENNLLRALTTDSSLHGKRYSNTSVFYEADVIRSWDNNGGFISLSTKIHASSEITAQYYYSADDYEYTGVNLNPLYNKSIRDKLVVFYIIPNADPDDNAIHHLVVDSGGVIVECSQSDGFVYRNLQLLNSDGSYNSDTVIGKKYASDITDDTFLDDYAVGYANTNSYAILAEVVFTSHALEDDMIVYDVREQGASLRPDTLEEALIGNPKILQSAVMYGEDGQEIPKNKVAVIQAPLSLRDDYGGTLKQDVAENLLTKHLDSSCLGIVEWVYPKPEITATSLTTGSVDLEWTWEGAGLTYKLYRRETPSDTWVEIHSVAGAGVPANITYTDTGLTTDSVMYYTVRAEETINSQQVLYPVTHSIGVKVA